MLRAIRLTCGVGALGSALVVACGARTGLFVEQEAIVVDAAGPPDVFSAPPEAAPPFDAPMFQACNVVRTSDEGVWCCSDTCALGTSCCPDTECPGGKCGKLAIGFNCDDQHDCIQSGAINDVCCARVIGGEPVAFCLTPEKCNEGGGLALCDPSDPQPCVGSFDGGGPGQCVPAGMGTAAQRTIFFEGYFFCE